MSVVLDALLQEKLVCVNITVKITEQGSHVSERCHMTERFCSFRADAPEQVEDGETHVGHQG